MVKEEKCVLPPCPGPLENKELSSLSAADLGFVLFNINQGKFKIPYAKSASCRSQSTQTNI